MDFKEINHLLELARIELSSQEKEKIASNLGKILDYVKQLQELDTNNIDPMTGGTLLENICREDNLNEKKQDLSKELKKSAPNLKNDSFKIPPIF